MNRIPTTLCICIALVSIPALNNSRPIQKSADHYTVGTTVTLKGYIITSTYLSRTDNSDKEYFNSGYLLRLNSGIDIYDARDGAKQFTDIKNIEIADPYSHEIHRFTDKNVSIKGILRIFPNHPGYHRQYSTPIQIEIIEIDLN